MKIVLECNVLIKQRKGVKIMEEGNRVVKLKVLIKSEVEGNVLVN